MKIAVIGYSGSGKSSLAASLARKYFLPLMHLDRVHFLPGWKEREIEDEVRIVGEFLDSNSSWVIDGNYNKLHFDRRMQEADRIILMCFNRFSSLYRVLRRYHRYKGRARSSVADGCEEKIDREFLFWVLYKGRTGKRRAVYRSVRRKYSEKVTVINNQRALDEFYKENIG